MHNGVKEPLLFTTSERKKRRIDADGKVNQQGICIQCVKGFARRLESFLVETYPTVSIQSVDVPLNLVFFTCRESDGDKSITGEEKEPPHHDKKNDVQKEQGGGRELVALVKSLYSHQYLLRYIVRFFYFARVSAVDELRESNRLGKDQDDKHDEYLKKVAEGEKKINADEDGCGALHECLSSILDRTHFPPRDCIVRAQVWPKAQAEDLLVERLEARGIAVSPTAFTHVLCVLSCHDKWYWGLYDRVSC